MLDKGRWDDLFTLSKDYNCLEEIFENLGVFEHQMHIEQSSSKKFQMTSF